MTSESDCVTSSDREQGDRIRLGRAPTSTPCRHRRSRYSRGHNRTRSPHLAPRPATRAGCGAVPLGQEKSLRRLYPEYLQLRLRHTHARASDPCRECQTQQPELTKSHAAHATEAGLRNKTDGCRRCAPGKFRIGADNRILVATWLPRRRGIRAPAAERGGCTERPDWVEPARNTSTFDASPRRATVVVEALREGSIPDGVTEFLRTVR